MNKNVNQNFLEDEEEIEYEEVPEDEITDADEILDEVEEEIQTSRSASQQISKAFSEAEKRIEQANLYKAILNSNLFGKGSARPEIIKIVDKELKEFVMYRLEVLLGIKSEGGVRGAAPAQMQSPFSKNEIAALKDLASKLINRQGPQAAPQAATPVITPITGNQEQSIEPVTGEQDEEPPQRQVRMVKRVVSRTQNGQPKPVGKKPRRPKSNNISEVTGEDLSQASNPARPPVPMPSASMMNAMNAEIAEKNARGGMQATGGMLNAHLKNLIK